MRLLRSCYRQLGEGFLGIRICRTGVYKLTFEEFRRCKKHLGRSTALLWSGVGLNQAFSQPSGRDSRFSEDAVSLKIGS